MKQIKTNLLGHTFGKLTVTEEADSIQQGSRKLTAWKCTCDCGNIVVVTSKTLRRGDKKSCGCSTAGRILIDMVGQVFGNLTVVRQGISHKSAGGKYFSMWICRCKCGKEITVRSNKLRSRRSPSSCGCITKVPGIDQLYLWKKYDTSRRKLQFTLTIQEFSALIIQDCHYCGKPPSNLFKARKESIQYSGIDRKHNDQGYISGNCLPCCSHCNSMKLDMNYDDFIEKIRLVYSRLG